MQLHDQLRQVVALAPAHLREADLEQLIGVGFSGHAGEPEGKAAQVEVHLHLCFHADHSRPRQAHQAPVLAHVEHAAGQGAALGHQVQHGGRLAFVEGQYFVFALELWPLGLLGRRRRRLELLFCHLFDYRLRFRRQGPLQSDDRAALRPRRGRNRPLDHLGCVLVHQAGQQRSQLVPGAAGGMNEADADGPVPGGPLRDAPDAEHHLLNGENHLHGFQSPSGKGPLGTQPASAQADVQHLAGDRFALVEQGSGCAIEGEAVIGAVVPPAGSFARVVSLLAARLLASHGSCRMCLRPREVEMGLEAETPCLLFRPNSAVT